MPPHASGKHRQRAVEASKDCRGGERAWRACWCPSAFRAWRHTWPACTCRRGAPSRVRCWGGLRRSVRVGQRVWGEVLCSAELHGRCVSDSVHEGGNSKNGQQSFSLMRVPVPGDITPFASGRFCALCGRDEFALRWTCWTWSGCGAEMSDRSCRPARSWGRRGRSQRTAFKRAFKL